MIRLGHFAVQNELARLIKSLMKVPNRYQTMADSVRQGVERFFLTNKPEDSVLVVDSTGPMVTRQYLILNAIGKERLLRMDQIHSFSGGTFALFVYLGLISGFGRVDGRDIGGGAGEKMFRQIHHEGAFSVPRALLNLVSRRPVFNSARPVLASLDHILKIEFTRRLFNDLPPNIHLHLGCRKTKHSVILNHRTISTPDFEGLRLTSMNEVIAMSVAAPMLYGPAGTSGEFFDAVYASDHRQFIKRVCSSGRPTVVSTPWRSGSKGSILFLQCMPYKNKKLTMLRDVTKMILNIKNPDWVHDVAVAFTD